MTCSTSVTLTRFGADVGSRLKGSFDAEIEGTYQACDAGDCTPTTRTGHMTGTFDVVIEEIPTPPGT